MKLYSNSLLFLLCFCGLFKSQAQVPRGINYQAIIRDGGGNPVVNQNVSLNFIFTNASNATYGATQTATTNDYGLVNIVIGEDDADLLAFDWSDIPVNLRVIYGGSTISNAPLMSVPYALHCATADAVLGGSTITASNGLIKSGDDVRLGGSLSSNTDIDMGGNDLAFNNNVVFEVRNGVFWLRNMSDNRDVLFADMDSYSIRMGSPSNPVLFTYIDGNQGINKVLTSDANGVATWQTPTASPWLVNGANIYYSGGNVGVGTPTPRAKLEVLAGDGTAGVTEVLRVSAGSSATGSGPAIGFHNSYGDVGVEFPNWKLAEISAEYTCCNYFGDLVFRTNSGGQDNPTEKMRILSNGSVGIGTSTPFATAKLHVEGNTLISGFTKLGGEIDAPAIKMKTFTTTTAATEGGAASIAHGVADPSKIIAMYGVCEYFPANFVPQEYSRNPNYAFSLYVSGNIIYVYNHASYTAPPNTTNALGSSQILAKPVKVTILYTE